MFESETFTFLVGPEDIGGVFWLLSELYGIQGAAVVPEDHPRRWNRPPISGRGESMLDFTILGLS